MESKYQNILKFFIGSGAGLILFFVPVTVNGRSSILIDQLVTSISTNLPTAALAISLSPARSCPLSTKPGTDLLWM